MQSRVVVMHTAGQTPDVARQPLPRSRQPLSRLKTLGLAGSAANVALGPCSAASSTCNNSNSNSGSREQRGVRPGYPKHRRNAEGQRGTQHKQHSPLMQGSAAVPHHGKPPPAQPGIPTAESSPTCCCCSSPSPSPSSAPLPTQSSSSHASASSSHTPTELLLMLRPLSHWSRCSH